MIFVNKSVRIGSMLILTCLLSACGKNTETDNTFAVDTVVELSEPEDVVSLPEYSVLDDHYGFQASKVRNDESATYIASVVKDGINQSYSIYNSYSQEDNNSVDYVNMSLVFVGDDCYLYETHGAIGSTPDTDTVYKVTDPNFQSLDFTEFDFYTTIVSMLSSVSSYEDKGVTTFETESGSYEVNNYDCMSTVGIATDGLIKLQIDKDSDLLRKMAFNGAVTNTEYTLYEYQDDGMFSEIGQVSDEINYDEALNLFKDAVYNAEIIVASESNEAQKELFEHEEVLE